MSQICYSFSIYESKGKYSNNEPLKNLRYTLFHCTRVVSSQYHYSYVFTSQVID